tara:strand:+ start:8413 stop:8634 length:222 start_codon:yes stop_codon:yes gene_type:complete
MEEITNIETYKNMKEDARKKKLIEYANNLVLESIELHIQKCISEGDLEKGQRLEDIHEVLKSKHETIGETNEQ